MQRKGAGGLMAPRGFPRKMQMRKWSQRVDRPVLTLALL